MPEGNNTKSFHHITDAVVTTVRIVTNGINMGENESVATSPEDAFSDSLSSPARKHHGSVTIF